MVGTLAPGRGLLAAAVTLALTAAAPVELPFDRVTLDGNATPREHLEAIARQTGVRFAGLEALRRRPRRPLQIDGRLHEALDAAAAAHGLLLTRSGPYDYLVTILPSPPPALPAAESGELRAELLQVADEPADELLRRPRRWSAVVRLTGPPEALATVYGLDLADCELVCDRGTRHPALAARAPETDAATWRLERPVAIAFEPPPARCRRLALRLALVRFESVRWHRVELAPEVGASIVDGALRLTVGEPRRSGDRWHLSLVAALDELTVGDEAPWLEAAMRGPAGQPLRPVTLSASRLRAEDDRSRWEHRMTFALPAGAEPGALLLAVAERRGPWRREVLVIDDVIVSAEPPPVLGPEPPAHGARRS